MKIFTRYILLEMLTPFLLGLLVFTFILLFGQIYQLIDLIINKGVEVWTTVKLFLYFLPALLAVTIPLALLLSCLIAFGRLSGDNEIIAARAIGVGLRRLLIPPLWVGLALSVGMLYFNDTALPAANRAYKNLLYEILEKHATVLIQERTFITGFAGYIFYIKTKDDKSGALRDVVVYNLGNDRKASSTIFAKTGRLVTDKRSLKVSLELNDGVIHQLGQQNTSTYSRLFFTTYHLNLDISRSLGDTELAKSPREMRRREIALKIAEEQKVGGNVNVLYTEYHLKWAIPFACLAFTLIGAPLGSISRRGGKFMGGALSLGLIFIYYILLFAGQIAGDRGIVPASLSVWFPNLVFGGLGVFLLVTVSQEKPLPGL